MAKAKVVTSEPRVENPGIKPQGISSKHINRLKILGVILTLGGIVLFSYFVYSVGVNEILNNVERFGFIGFAIILAIYFARICMRAAAWKLSVYEPYTLGMRDTVPAVIIGEAMSSMIPLGILVSGTSKAVAVRKRVPLVVGLSSIATENLFYTFTTSVFLMLGAFTFVRSFELEQGWVITINILIGCLIGVLILGLLMVVRQWHFASETCAWLYRKGIARGILENGRLEVRLFENFIYGFYRRYPRRFLPICLIEAAFHLLGILEVFFILSRIVDTVPHMLNAFLLESVSRLITIIFKLVPFLIGVDEAGAQFVAETVALGAGIGVTLAIIRKGRILFWTAIGLIIIIKRGLSLREISRLRKHGGMH
ncbi:MAG: lysylphosphatidylglycerol synthase domain-containing protein [Pyrinomonadaceae bacterium]|nr:flippase-like domain-containing protein [Blastocatellia bacterium]MDQ3221830.1 flippase-like domain-containing protein [Acidobacteriota bacterium]